MKLKLFVLILVYSSEFESMAILEYITLVDKIFFGGAFGTELEMLSSCLHYGILLDHAFGVY